MTEKAQNGGKGTELPLEGFEQPGGHRVARKAKDSEQGTEHIRGRRKVEKPQSNLS